MNTRGGSREHRYRRCLRRQCGAGDRSKNGVEPQAGSLWVRRMRSARQLSYIINSPRPVRFPVGWSRPSGRSRTANGLAIAEWNKTRLRVVGVMRERLCMQRVLCGRWAGSCKDSPMSGHPAPRCVLRIAVFNNEAQARGRTARAMAVTLAAAIEEFTVVFLNAACAA